MSNEQVFEEVLDLSGGDDFDGCFTETGREKFNAAYNEFRRRLEEIGFFE